MTLDLTALGDAIAPYAKDVISSIPGASQVVQVAQAYNTNARANVTNRLATQPPPVVLTAPSPSPWYASPFVAIAGVGLVLVGLVVALMPRRR